MERKKSVMYIFLEGAAALSVIFMLGLFPLYYQDNYIDMSSAKLNFFRVCSIGLLVATALFLFMDWMQRYKEKMQEENKRLKRKIQVEKEEQKLGKAQAMRQWLGNLPVTAKFAAVFTVGLLIATAFSANPQESWMGLEGRKLGTMVWLLCISMYLILGKYLNLGKWAAWVFLAANVLVCVLAILNFWAIDPLGMYKNLAAEQHGGFISTIGNINACAGYMCMVVPAGMALYFVAKDKYLRAASGVFLAIGFHACYCTGSQSWVLGLFVSMLILLWFALCTHERMLRFLQICIFFWASSVCLKAIMAIADSVGYRTYMFLNFKGNSLQHEVMLNGYLLAAAGILIAGALFFVWRREKSGKGLSYGKIRKIVFIMVAAAACLGILLFAAANLNHSAWEGTFSVLEHLRLQDAWGSSRGYIWRITVEAWLGLPLWDKITGYGVNYFHMFIQQYCGTEASQYFGGALLVDAHNELMQILTTMGVLGVVGYFGLLISMAVKSAKKVPARPSLVLGVIVVCSYMAQGLVNNPTVFLTPYLFVMLGIIESMGRGQDAKK